jgi:cell division protein DivIC
VIVSAGSLAGWMLIAVGAQHLRTYTLAREAARLEQRRQSLLSENAALRVEIQRLRTDDRYIERLAREQLGMLRPGEMELVPVPAPERRAGAEEPAGPREELRPGSPGIGRAIREAAGRLLALLGHVLGR